MYKINLIQVLIALLPLGFCSLLGFVRRYLATAHTLISVYFPRGNVNHLIHSRYERSRTKRASSSVVTQVPCPISLVLTETWENRASGSVFLSPQSNSCSLQMMGFVGPSHIFKVIWLSWIQLPIHREKKNADRKSKTQNILCFRLSALQVSWLFSFKYNVDIVKFMVLFQHSYSRSRHWLKRDGIRVPYLFQ